ncbi:hypothetical protein DYB25_000606 [Aphanomyces astaci]|nr:hypothetical protein DYB25_000606 [Aphanomyces astaci]RHZ06352.1 hypothetical protein DYB31_000773 [Aphanomyces astaci]RHZ20914.1 hypothetical protein DYB26_000530 [Aphanomyces astaci]
MDGDRDSHDVEDARSIEPLDSVVMSREEEAERARLMLEQRFLLHKRMRKDAKAKHDAIKAKASRRKDSHVDHKNMPHKWKDAAVLEQELKHKEHTKVLMGPEPIRQFPGKVYTTSPIRDRDADRLDAIDDYAASAAKNDR